MDSSIRPAVIFQLSAMMRNLRFHDRVGRIVRSFVAIEHRVRFEPAFGVDGSNAAGASGCDRLTIDMVLAIAAREYAWNIREGSLPFRLNVADLVHVDETSE